MFSTLLTRGVLFSSGRPSAVNPCVGTLTSSKASGARRFCPRTGAKGDGGFGTRRSGGDTICSTWARRNEWRHRRLLHHFLKSKAARRIIGFQSSGVARYFPKLWQYMAHTMEGIQENQPTLRRPFENSVYPAFSANLGPNTVTFEHCDGHNFAHGVCPITSFGKFNHKIGGHLYMRQLKLAIEFPSGSSVAIMSGAFDHGNAPIMKGETRYSMTQYAAGALFRWSAYGYQTAKTLLATPGGVEKKAQFDERQHARAVGLLSKVDEVEADRRQVFDD
ncbi:hypothetical protein B0H14DRAFT_3133297 [Mycena olivaceomarginata]|nr:hypothetical protein B0H14DRAFT_3133297 [Mycena olivaceomarginata]